MKKFLIATILALSCSTASAANSSYYIGYWDSVQDNAKLDNYYKSLLSKIEDGLKEKGHKVSKSPLDYQPAISVHFISTTTGKLFAISYTITRKNGTFLARGVVSADRSGHVDTSWAARYILNDIN